MSWLTFHLRSLAFHWKSHLWVALAVAVAAAVLTGALIVGDSMRDSLRELAIGRLGKVDYLLTAPRLFQADLAKRVGTALNTFDASDVSPSPALLARAAATHATRRSRVGKVNVWGVEESFWKLDTAKHLHFSEKLARGEIILNEPLAHELGAAVGDDVILHLGKPNTISTETLLGRRDETTASPRFTVKAVLAPRGLAAMDVTPRQAHPQNAFVSLEALQRSLDQEGKANVLLATGHPTEDHLERALASAVSLADVGLQIRRQENRQGAIVQSEALLIEPALERNVLGTATAMSLKATRFLAYLANTISKEPHSDAGKRLIPYSTVVAVPPDSFWMEQLAAEAQPAKVTLDEGGILLNQWAADDLDAKPGDRVEISYYVTGNLGELETRESTLTLQGIVPLGGIAADPDLVPSYKGVTDAKSLADWDPPFPIDLKLIREKDEVYWKQHRTTPKAFVSLGDGTRLWAKDADRLGRVSSIQLAGDLQNLEAEFGDNLRRRLDPAALGLRFEPVRQRWTASATGPTDFGMLFLSFSFFLFASAAMLVALMFRLGVETRSFEMGLMLATGFRPRAVFLALLTQGLFVSLLGTIIGLVAASGFAWLMLAGLRSWWSQAVNSPVLHLHLRPSTLVLGALVSLAIAAATIGWSVRGLSRRAPRALLAGSSGDLELAPTARNSRLNAAMACLCIAVLVAGVILGLRAQALMRSLAFFLSGASGLALCLLGLVGWLRTPHLRPITIPGAFSLFRMGLRSARRNRRRSVLTAGLIASAAFLIISLDVFRLDPGDARDKHSGSGGFFLYAESAAPLPYDLGTESGRENLGLSTAAIASLSSTRVESFRLRPGDDSSCLNLYRPTRPRILGAADSFLNRGAFAFVGSLAQSQAERENPWVLLRTSFSDGAVPAIADANAVQWQYHLGLGKDLVIQDDGGRDVRLRFVGLLSNSTLQDEIIVGDAQFRNLFPSISGRSFFLIETSNPEVERLLEGGLEPFGFDAATTQSRLTRYFAVQNTYISTFQTLGGLGLLLGAAGLAVVLVRNVWERRRELALMRTAGFTRRALGWMVIAENLTLVMAGLLSGMFSAALSVAPLLSGEGRAPPVLRLALLLAGVVLIGMLGGVVAVSRALRAPLIPALRSE